MAEKRTTRSRKRPGAKDLAPRRHTQAKGGDSAMLIARQQDIIITGAGPQPSPARSRHPGGVNFLMADGAVRN